MKLLINKQDIEKYVQLSLHRKDAEIERYIREVQLFDLKTLVCDAFFVDLTDEDAQTDYALLLNGGNYEYEGKKHYFEGLKACLTYFFYARYVFKSHQKDTATGLVMKENTHSSAISVSEKRDLQKLYLQDADKLWTECLLYLQRNQQKYPYFEKCNEGCKEQSNNARLKFSIF